ncbi:hopanoid biosynthesis-associated protein HpnK [Enterovirga sp.]|uniref:hopanoid biosynthesis-associated protein HpnK n=1 Tax=Enterovirga sp. TaxID=2026350 RepID=UPI0026332978|nr:hopanoid biosynthesis-associated protein HpnK [Enterovirga sp.]MDB5591450.1 hopanoid biosynthesis associated protein HpnK [Enterovirga sp.]
MDPARASLVVTADDFGLSREVNEAVEIGHRRGILTAASLMVAEPWCVDAVLRARRLPGLAVGLHLTLVEGRAVLPRSEIPDLVGPDGRLRQDLARYGADIFFRPGVKRQVAAEIRAQFQAFRRTGLALDHVNAHKHYHLHPTVAGLVLRIGREFGMTSLRVPVEPAAVLAQVEPTRRGLEARLAGPYAALLRGRARRAGLTVADQVFGLAWSGAVDPGRMAGLLRALAPGRTEIYLHPATAGGFDGAAPGYRYADELAALVLPASRAALAESGAAVSSYSSWAGTGAIS